MTLRAERRTDVDPGHDRSAERRAKGVGVLRQHDLIHLDDGVRRGVRFDQAHGGELKVS